MAQKVVEQCEKMTQGMALRALSHDLSQALALVRSKPLSPTFFFVFFICLDAGPR